MTAISPAIDSQTKTGNASLTDNERLTQVCKATADPLRVSILQVLRSDSFGVLELCAIFDLAQPKLSHHLKVLAQAGLVSTRRDGNSIFYRRPLLDLTDPLAGLIQSLFVHIDQLSADTGILERMGNAKAARSRSSLDFFAKNASKFREKQALVVENSHYVDSLQELLDTAKLDSDATAIEIGPGEGDYLPALADHFNRVIAIDNSPQMLARAQERAAQHQLTNINFMLGDCRHAVTQQAKGDLAICNMVLHHIPSPASTFQDIAELLNPGGYLLLAELCHHDQAWVKESCGDIWLGFEPNEIKHWAIDAQLRPLQELYLGLRNGFQIQLHLFRKALRDH